MSSQPARASPRRRELSFDEVAANLEQARQVGASLEPVEEAALVDEVKLHCTHAAPDRQQLRSDLGRAS